MNDELAAANVDLERERFDNLCEIHTDSLFLYQNRIKTDLIEPKGLSAERKQMPQIVENQRTQ